MLEYVLLMFCSCSLLRVLQSTPAPHALKDVNLELDLEFKNLDLNKNGFVEVQEYDNIMKYWDYNNDGCASMSEFFRAHQSDSLDLEWALFKHYDRNNDGCIQMQDLSDEYGQMDKNPKDGTVTVQEFEAYYDHLLAGIGFLRV